MSTIGCTMVMVGMMVCRPDYTVIQTYVAGDLPKRSFETSLFLKAASEHHQAVWGHLTDDMINAAFSDWGPRRYLPIDWSRVRRVKGP